ncbi:MAG: rod-binding protein [Deferribacterota bacterium]|nr:rod-binding protein [Deferribacterota bacterium]
MNINMVSNNLDNVVNNRQDTINRLQNLDKKSDLSYKELKKLKKACADFEAIFYHMILKTSRESISDDGFIKQNRAEKIFTDMLDNEVSKQTAYRSSNGIKDMLFSYFLDAMNLDVNSSDIKIDVEA